MIELNEGIIPQNFSWRAGIGKDNSEVPQQNSQYLQQAELYDGGIKLTREKIVPQWPYGNVDLTEQLIPEIDTRISEIVEKYSFEQYDIMLQEKIKENVKMACLEIKLKYRMYLNENFYNRLYIQCKKAFEQNFLTFDNNVNALTEFAYKNGELRMNPLLIWGYFQL